MPEARPYKCSWCQLSFGRKHHLNRHAEMHTGEKRYRCPCGETFFRSDLLVRHLRRCEIGREDLEKIAERAQEKRTRKKRACARCARSKAKCDGQVPCSRCSQHSLQCNYNRGAPVDLYGSYSINQRKTTSAVADHQACDTDDLSLTPDSATSLEDLSMSYLGRNNYCEILLDSDSVQSELVQMDCNIFETNSAQLSNFAPQQNNHSLQYQHNILNFDVDAMLREFNFLTEIPLDMSLQPQLLGAERDQLTVSNPWTGTSVLGGFSDFEDVLHDDSSRLSPQNGFSYERMDPIEAKCEELRSLLMGSEPLFTQSMVTQHLTRDNLLLCCHLYGKNFQQNFPVLHSPSFDLVKTPPLLLLAIMIAGAGFEERRLPSKVITNLAMRILMLIEIERLGVKMDFPTPLSTIQASIISCSVLVRSRSEDACKFVSTHFHRNYLMIQTTGILGHKSLNYEGVTEETFDWQQWIKQESLRRAACEIFCQDVAGCIFRGISPSISPVDFDVELPCYESCWEATTASSCLRHLREMPSQISVSTAMKYLRSPSASTGPLFEASAFGMFVLIKGLHYLIYQASKHEMEFPQETSHPKGPSQPKATNEGSDLNGRLQQDLSGAAVATLADQVVNTKAGNLNLKNLNRALNAWRCTWDLRLFRESWCENKTYFHDPLPYWWLAKLYIFLHFNMDSIGQDNEFAVPRAERRIGVSLFSIQAKIIGWFSRFRKERHLLEKELIIETQHSCVSNNDENL